MMFRLLRQIRWQHVGAALAGIAIVVVIAALVLANDNADNKTAVQQTTQENVGKQLDALKVQLDQSEQRRRELTADRERWQAQITTSIEQLRDAGEQPIIVAPDAVPPQASEPVTTTTTTAPQPIVVPVPTPVTTNPPPPPSTTTTTTTTQPPSETTTTTTTTTTEVPQ